ncbi:hypothetical protein [Pseudomonas sp. A-RE-23]|uniref:hypothetical protein n=1 Tax=Pseudomonas TaxID=286 RepID=UPI001CBC76CC|nr:hypothetical protein [Pseudomonas sp. A-RE-23]
MSDKLVDHLWEKIIERDSQAKAVLSDKISKVVEITLRSRAVDGSDAANLVSDEGRLEYALRKCLAHLMNPESVSEMDYFIYYEYATGAARRADNILSE